MKLARVDALVQNTSYTNRAMTTDQKNQRDPKDPKGRRDPRDPKDQNASTVIASHTTKADTDPTNTSHMTFNIQETCKKLV